MNGDTICLQVSPPWSSLPAPLPCQSQVLWTWMHHPVLVCISWLSQLVLGQPPLRYGATLVCGSGDQAATGSWGHPWGKQCMKYCSGLAKAIPRWQQLKKEILVIPKQLKPALNTRAGMQHLLDLIGLPACCSCASPNEVARRCCTYALAWLVCSDACTQGLWVK